MAQTAPEVPTTQQLHELYPLNEVTQYEIEAARERVSGILSGDEPGLVAILGPCAMTGAVRTIRQEGAAYARLTLTEEGLQVVNRMPLWKPRTNPSDWHGLETGPEPGTDGSIEDSAHDAYRTLAVEATFGGGVAIELGQPYHPERYAHLLTFGWTGARNLDNLDVLHAVALHDLSLPLGVKNGLDGTIEPALRRIAELRELRATHASKLGIVAAPTVLIYRGGENAKDPSSWERQYREALEATGGHLVVDTAHGGEQAHDWREKYLKSEVGQKRALAHVVEIAQQHGEVPRGVMCEASAASSPTDPTIAPSVAIEGVRRLNALRRKFDREQAGVGTHT